MGRGRIALDKLIDELGIGADQALSVRELGERLGITPGSVATMINTARMQGRLIVQNERGYFFAITYEEFDRWRKTYVIPELVRILDLLTAMGRSARQQFGYDDSILPNL